MKRRKFLNDVGVSDKALNLFSRYISAQKVLLVLLLMIMMTSGCVFGRDSIEQTAANTKTEHIDRAAWMDEAKFGMFIHWGLYSQMGKGVAVNRGRHAY